MLSTTDTVGVEGREIPTDYSNIGDGNLELTANAIPKRTSVIDEILNFGEPADLLEPTSSLGSRVQVAPLANGFDIGSITAKIDEILNSTENCKSPEHTSQINDILYTNINSNIDDNRSISSYVSDNASIDIQDTSSIDRQDIAYIDGQDTSSIDRQDTSSIDRQDIAFIDRQDIAFIDRQDIAFIDRQYTSSIDRQDIASIERQDNSSIERQDNSSIDRHNIASTNNSIILNDIQSINITSNQNSEMSAVNNVTMSDYISPVNDNKDIDGATDDIRNIQSFGRQLNDIPPPDIGDILTGADLEAPPLGSSRSTEDLCSASQVHSSSEVLLRRDYEDSIEQPADQSNSDPGINLC